MPTTLVISMKGAVITGTFTAPARGGAAATPINISDASFKDGVLAFSVSTTAAPRGGGDPVTTVTKYSGKLAADGKTINLTRTAPPRGGQGDPVVTADIIATKQ